MYPYTQSDLDSIPDKIDFVFNPTDWKDKGQTVYIGVYAAENVQEEVSFTIRARSYMPNDTLRGEDLKRNELFE